MQERKKAQQVFNETDFVFVEKSSFAKAFPTIETVNVEYEIKRYGQGAGSGKRGANEKSLGEYINCTNSVCYNGGYRIGDEIRSMVRENLTEKDFSGICQGNEASPKGKKVYRHCGNFFQGKIRIEYKTDTPTAEKPA